MTLFEACCTGEFARSRDLCGVLAVACAGYVLKIDSQDWHVRVRTYLARGRRVRWQVAAAEVALAGAIRVADWTRPFEAYTLDWDGAAAAAGVTGCTIVWGLMSTTPPSSCQVSSKASRTRPASGGAPPPSPSTAR